MYYLNYPALFNNYHVDISDEEKESILNAKEYLKNVSYIEEKFDFAVGNYYDFQKILLEKSLEDSIRPTFKVSDFMSCERELTRYLFNLLSTVYAYTEQIKKLKRKLNLPDSDVIDNYVKGFEGKNKSTKLIIDLRDHIQHFGISTNISRGFVDKYDDDHIRYLLYFNTLNLDIAECSKDSKMVKHLKFLKDANEKIEIGEHIKIYFKEFCQLHSQIRELINQELNKNIQIIEDIFDKFKKETNFDFGSDQKILGIFNDTDRNERHIFTNNTINEIKGLQEQYSNLSNIDSRFACNASNTQLQILKNM